MIDVPNISPIILILASVFTSNIVLSNFLGMCSFISISKDIKSAFGLGMAVTFVCTFSNAGSWIIYYYILVPFHLEYTSLIVYIIVIAAIVQILEMVIDRVSTSLYISLGIFLPLITVNCAVLGVILFMQIRNYSFFQSTLFGLASGAGWWLAIVTLAAIRKKVDAGPVPAALKGPGITLIIIGLMAMAFLGFSGMLQVQ
jgi:Na+-transporting NADH:ubiquinone oxidoreductase subunit E